MKLTKKQKECLMLMFSRANEHGGNLWDGCMTCFGMNARLRDSLLEKELAQYTTPGYGFGYGELLQITQEGYDIAKKLKEKGGDGTNGI